MSRHLIGLVLKEEYNKETPIEIKLDFYKKSPEESGVDEIVNDVVFLDKKYKNLNKNPNITNTLIFGILTQLYESLQVEDFTGKDGKVVFDLDPVQKETFFNWVIMKTHLGYGILESSLDSKETDFDALEDDRSLLEELFEDLLSIMEDNYNKMLNEDYKLLVYDFYMGPVFTSEGLCSACIFIELAKDISDELKSDNSMTEDHLFLVTGGYNEIHFLYDVAENENEIVESVGPNLIATKNLRELLDEDTDVYLSNDNLNCQQIFTRLNLGWSGQRLTRNGSNVHISRYDRSIFVIGTRYKNSILTLLNTGQMELKESKY